ncbi:DUF1289 domain-containing protein [Psychrosphaera haliotis]|uniref:DUF1289 domain-containing protein n=1 Tax=Psychrosphaera haliotis TaxID=555083 RepID=UPI0031D65C37
MTTEEVSSPCIRNCCLDEKNVCIGCYRDINEIMAWSKMSNSEKKLTLNRCSTRVKEKKGN